MSAINTPIHHSGYYQLNPHSGSGAGAENTQRSAGTAGLLRAPGRVHSSGYADAVLVDLSPEAKRYLSGLGNPGPGAVPAAQEHFHLSPQQRLALASLLEAYKDAPYTQATFDRIQDDMHKAGLGPDQLSARERVSSFSTTAALVDALNGGKGTTPGSQPVSHDELQKRATHYIQDVVSQWKKISSGYPSGNGNAVAAVGASEGAS